MKGKKVNDALKQFPERERNKNRRKKKLLVLKKQDKFHGAMNFSGSEFPPFFSFPKTGAEEKEMLTHASRP